MNYLFGCLIAAIACTTSLAGMEKQESDRIPKLKNLLIDLIIKRGIAVPKHVPEDIQSAIREKMLEGQGKINFINVLNKIPIPKRKLAKLPAGECIAGLSLNGNRLLAHHSEKMSMTVYTAEGKRLISVPHHCDCMTPPLHRFNDEGSLLILASHCSKTDTGLIEVVSPDTHDTQTISVGNRKIESLATNSRRSLFGFAGGCDQKIKLFRYPTNITNAQEVSSFGAGHLIEMNHDGTKLAAADHGTLLVYDISNLEAPNQLYSVCAYHIPTFQFYKHSDEIMIPLIGYEYQHANLITHQPEEHVKCVSLCEGTMLPATAFSDNGAKLTSLVNGIPRFTYRHEESEDKFLELPRKQQKFILICLHDDDTALTVCTDNALYRYDLKKFKGFESRFAKPLEHIAVEDVPVALALQNMTVQEYKECAQGDIPVQRNAFVKQEIKKLFGVPENSGSPSFIERMQLPFLGVAALLFAVCALKH